jgi:NAD(P)H dehydrogenase (quinone)
VPLGYTDPAVFQTGNPYGSSWSFQEGSGPDEATLTVARHQGSRLARVAALLRGEARAAEGAGAARGG